MSGQVVEEKASITLQAAPSTMGASSNTQNNYNSGAAVPGQRVRVSQGVAQGLIVSKVQPSYPDLARASRIQGTVLMKATISAAGDVVSLDLISGHPMLAPAAIDAVKQWKYKPYLLNGKAVTVETQIAVNFFLSGD
jgi:periplasmic protein TonB